MYERVYIQMYEQDWEGQERNKKARKTSVDSFFQFLLIRFFKQAQVSGFL